MLVVDDSALIKMGAVNLVKPVGREAQDADEAIRILESTDDIDLVFTDVQMPGTMARVKLAHFIGSRWPPMKLIGASGQAILEESSLPTGSHYFAKPYTDHAIQDAMARLLADDCAA